MTAQGNLSNAPLRNTGRNTNRKTGKISGTMPLSPALIKHQLRVRMFALVWMVLTLLIGAGAFAAVYMTTGVVSARALNAAQQGVPASDGEAAIAMVMQVTATRRATLPPEATATTVPATALPTQVEAAAPVAAGPTPTLIAATDTKFDLGVAVQKNGDPSVYKIWVDNVRDSLKLNWVKSQVVWRDTEKVKGQYDWNELDVAVNQLFDSNIRIMLSVTKAPDWARDPGAPTNQPGVFDGPPANPQDFADFLTAVLTRYTGKISAVEVWNEINLDREWSTSPKSISAARYVTLLQTAYKAIKATDPNILVISAALAPTGANIGGVVTDDFVHMDALIQAGMLDSADCVGTHHNGLNVPPDSADWRNLPERTPRAKYRGPWANPNHSWSFRATLEGYHQRIVAAGKNIPLCVTEFGWPSVEDLTGTLRSGFEFAADNTLADQAAFTDRAITYMEQSGWVRLAFVWNLNYGPQAGWDISGPVGDNVPWSLFGPNYARRPAWEEIAKRNYRAQPR